MKAAAVRAFECGVCKRLRRDKAKTDACCKCRCGRPIRARWSDRCTDCGKRNAIRRAAADVRRVEVVLEARKAALARARAA